MTINVHKTHGGGIMAIQLKNDVSYLFSSLNNNSNSSYGINSLYSLLGDYNSIKTGSYGKLMKAYYSNSASDSVSSLVEDATKTTYTSAESKAVATAQTKVSSLEDTMSRLYTSEEDSIWAEGDKDKIYDVVSSFVTGYNEVLNSISDVNSTTVNNRGLTLINNTEMYKDDLAKIGITINEDDTLKLDKETFAAADVEQIEAVFSGRGSFGHIQSSQVELLKSAVDYEAVSASTYNSNATYNTLGTTGSLFDSLF